MEMSMSVTPGKGYRRHNFDLLYRRGRENVDPSRSDLNVVLREVDLDKAYRVVFDESLRAYNAKQVERGRPERQIANYLTHIKNSKQERPEWEFVVQLGDKDTNPATDKLCRERSCAVLRRFVELCDSKYPNMVITAAVVHLDEATPHLHVDFVPVSRGNKRGLEVKNSYRGMLRDLGFTSAREFENSQGLRDGLMELLKEAAAEHGINRLDMKNQNKHLAVMEFKDHVKNIAHEALLHEDVQNALLDFEKVYQEELERTCVRFTEFASEMQKEMLGYQDVVKKFIEQEETRNFVQRRLEPLSKRYEKIMANYKEENRGPYNPLWMTAKRLNTKRYLQAIRASVRERVNIPFVKHESDDHIKGPRPLTENLKDPHPPQQSLDAKLGRAVRETQLQEAQRQRFRSGGAAKRSR